jgi:hypothetical protein
LTEHISALPLDISSQYVLGLTPDVKKLDATDLGSAQFFLFNQSKIRSINGYIPVGHLGILKLIPYPLVYGIFFRQETLKKISQPSDVDADI